MCTRNFFRYVFCIFLSVYFSGCDNPLQLLDEKAKEIKDLQSQISVLKQRNLRFQEKVMEFEKMERDSKKYRRNYEKRINKLNAEIADSLTAIAEMRKAAKSSDDEIRIQALKEIAGLKRKIAGLKRRLVHAGLEKPGSTKYVLTMEGGGTRGIIAAAFLARLDAEILNSQPSDKNTTPKFFDFISGTSIGGINALFLASDHSKIPAGMDVPDTSGASLLKVYDQDNIESIFTENTYNLNYYGSRAPMYIGKASFLQRLYGVNTTFGSLAKPVLILAYDYADNKPYYFSSYDEEKKDASVLVWQIADGTSAAPSFFPMTVIDLRDERGDPLDKLYTMDGSFLSNNSCVNAYNEMRKEFPHDRIKILSLSSGSFSPKLTDEEAEDWIDASSVAWINSYNYPKGKLIERFITAPALNASENCKRLLKDDFMHVPFHGAPVTAIDETREAVLTELKTAAREEFGRVKDELRAFLDIPSAAEPASL